jgi:ribosomal protein S18 acetylase RimI-like enzyme
VTVIEHMSPGSPRVDEISEFLFSISSLYEPPLSEQVHIDSYSQKISKLADIFVAAHDGSWIGLLAIYANDLPTKVSFVTTIGVKPQYRGTGIATSLMNEAMGYVRDVGFSYVRLEVHTRNQRARNFYERLGFSEVEVRPQRGMSLLEKAL